MKALTTDFCCNLSHNLEQKAVKCIRSDVPLSSKHSQSKSVTWIFAGTVAVNLFFCLFCFLRPLSAAPQNQASYLAALTGADAVVVARGLVLTHKARLVCARRRRRRRRTGEHVVGAGAGGLAADGCREGKGECVMSGASCRNNHPSAGFITATFVCRFFF